MTLAELLIKLRVAGTSTVKIELDDVSKSVKKTGDSALKALTPLEELGKRLWLLGRFHLGFLTAKKSIEEAANLDTLKMSLLTVEGTMGQVQNRLKDLRQIALMPGIDIQNAVRGYTALRTSGMGYADALKDIEAIGNAVARQGGNKEAVEGVMRAMLQIKDLPSLMGQEIIQLSNWMVGSRQLIKDALGTANTDDLRKMGITGEQAYRKIVDQMKTMSKAQPGIQTNLKLLSDQFNMTIASIGEVMAALLAIATPSLLKILQFFEQLPKVMVQASTQTANIVETLVTFATILHSPKLIQGVIGLIDLFKKLKFAVLELGIFTAIAEALATGGATAAKSIAGASAVLVGSIGVGMAAGAATKYLLDRVGQVQTDKNNVIMPPKLEPLVRSGNMFSGEGLSSASKLTDRLNLPPGTAQRFISRDGGLLMSLQRGLLYAAMAIVDERRMLSAKLGEIADNTRKTWSALDLRAEMFGGGVLARAGVTAGERRAEMSGQLVSQFAGATVTVGGSQLERQIRKVIQDERRRGLAPMRRS